MLALSKAEALPPVTLSGGPRFHPPADWGVLFAVKAPVPVLNQNQGEIAAAQLALAQLPQEYAQEHKALQQEWQEAHLGWQAAQEQALLLQSQRERLAQIVAHVRQTLAAGKQTAQDLLAAEQALVRKQQQLLDAQQAEQQAALRCYAFLPQLWSVESVLP
jgi:outer membrane protein TolC